MCYSAFTCRCVVCVVSVRGSLEFDAPRSCTTLWLGSGAVTRVRISSNRRCNVSGEDRAALYGGVLDFSGSLPVAS